MQFLTKLTKKLEQLLASYVALIIFRFLAFKQQTDEVDMLTD